MLFSSCHREPIPADWLDVLGQADGVGTGIEYLRVCGVVLGPEFPADRTQDKPGLHGFNIINFGLMHIMQSIQNRIYDVRGQRVMLDKDLAALYGTATKALNLAVKRNLKRFPKNFMFQLTKDEWEALRFQVETSANREPPLRLQIETSKTRGGTRYLPYVFTEQGVAMLSGILSSDRAINMHIAIMRAFVEVRKVLLQHSDLKQQLHEIRDTLGNHDTQLNQIYDAMENLLDEKAAPLKWEDRQRIGFKS